MKAPGATTALAPILTPSPTRAPNFVGFGLDPRTLVHERNRGCGHLVAVVGDDRAGFEIDGTAENAVADEIEMRELCAFEHERRFQLGSRTEHASAFQPAAAAQIGSGSDEAVRSDDRRSFDDRPFLDDCGAMHRDVGARAVAFAQAAQKLLDDLDRIARQFPRRPIRERLQGRCPKGCNMLVEDPHAVS